MHTALQTARNQASLETPLRAEELLTAHFNLAVLEDQKDTDKSPDAQKSTDNTQDTEPSASAPDEQMYIKIPSPYAENSATRRPHPTGAVAPTCRCEYGLVNMIPAGYESDDSWDNLSHNHVRTDGIQQDCLYIKQGHLMTPTTFMTYLMGIDIRKTVVVTWTPIRM